LFQFKKVLLAVVALSLWPGALFAADNPFLPKLPLEEGIVHYHISGSVQGERLLYLKDFGKYRALFSKTDRNILGPDRKEERLQIMNAEWVIDYDFVHHRGKRYHRLAYWLQKKLAALPADSQKRILENLKKAGGISPEDLLKKRYRCAEKIRGFEGYMVEENGESLCKSQKGGMLLQSSVDILGYHVTTTLGSIRLCRLKEGYFTLPAQIAVTLDTKAESDQEEKAERILQRLQKNEPALEGLLPAPDRRSENLHLIIEEGVRSLERIL